METLLSTARTKGLNQFHLQKIEAIDATDFTSVRRKTAKDLAKLGIVLSETYLDEGILALKQYYGIALLDPLNMHAVSDSVDPFWHSHILHTRDYMEFCVRTVGGYMHHEPLDHENATRLRNAARAYSYTMECFERFYTYVNPEFFPKTLAQSQLICWHFNNTVYGQAPQYALLPALPEMQPSFMLA